MNAHISRENEELLESLMHGKLPRNLSWSAVTELIGQVGKIEAHGNDEFVFVVGSKRDFFKKPKTHDLGLVEISRLRSFLHEAGALERPAQAAQSGQMIVALDHLAAHIYGGQKIDAPKDEVTVKPYDPFGFQRHLIHRKEAHYVGERVPEEHAYYEEIAHDLVTAKEIVLIGDATGTSSAAEFLSEYLKKHHPETFRKIVATERIDLSALTEPEIEAIAKKAFSRFGSSGSPEFSL